MEIVKNNKIISKEDYVNVLRLYTSFVDDLPQYNNWMKKPFCIDKYAIATDTVVIVWFDKSLTFPLDCIDDNASKNVLNVIQKETNQDLIIKISDIKEAFDKHGVSGYAKCKSCNGSGIVNFEYNYNNEEFIKKSDCPVCDGDGKNSNLDDFHMDILDCRLSTNAINTLLYTANILSEPTITLNHQTTASRASLFKIGNVNTLVMPCLKSEYQTVILTIK
jgi:predicted Zn-ribbon and HTH transcriptional regulator